MPTKLKCRLAAPDDDVHLDIRLENEDVTGVAMSQAAMCDDAIPWRTFRMIFGQTHYSVAYWSATEEGHVIYESQLELSRLLLADFDAHVTHIVAATLPDEGSRRWSPTPTHPRLPPGNHPGPASVRRQTPS